MPGTLRPAQILLRRFPKLGIVGPFIIRIVLYWIIICWGLFVGPLIYGVYHLFELVATGRRQLLSQWLTPSLATTFETERCVSSRAARLRFLTVLSRHSFNVGDGDGDGGDGGDGGDVGDGGDGGDGDDGDDGGGRGQWQWQRGGRVAGTVGAGARAVHLRRNEGFVSEVFMAGSMQKLDASLGTTSGGGSAHQQKMCAMMLTSCLSATYEAKSKLGFVINGNRYVEQIALKAQKLIIPLLISSALNKLMLETSLDLTENPRRVRASY